MGSIGIGQTQQFTATGTYSNLSTQNLTNSVTWSTSKAARTATISPVPGLATGVANGAVTITATDPSFDIPGTAALTVTPAVLVGIVVTPPVASIAAGQTEQFTATGTYSNLSTQNVTNSVTWSTSKAATATISSSGLATGVANGVVTITATDPSTGIPGTAALTVTPAVLVAITVTPPVGTIAVGRTEQFTATGLYSNLSTQNLTDSVTWSSSNTSTATVSAKGLATGVADGLATITATDPSTGIPGTAVLTVGLSVTALTMNPSSGPKKTPVDFSGVGFTPGDVVTVTYMSGKEAAEAGQDRVVHGHRGHRRNILLPRDDPPPGAGGNARPEDHRGHRYRRRIGHGAVLTDLTGGRFCQATRRHRSVAPPDVLAQLSFGHLASR